ncbi:MAG: multidrug ABC transporter permease [Rhodospirillales bacterium 12-54-5]|nr:MAG: multidrug ABC transporter permease [Rhodospirillales bacterium 12-54-5]
MAVNWIGMGTLYKRETWRFLKVWNQTLVAPMITTTIFLAIFALALGGNARMVHGVHFIEFIAPGLIMMAMVQNAFANTSSSFIIAKLQGVIIDWLMPPFAPGELTIGFALGGVTRGLMVGCTVAIAMSFFVPLHVHSVGLLMAFAVLSCAMMALFGVVTGIFANTPDQGSAITNFFVTPLSFLSGTFYSVQDLPSFFQHISHANPFFYMIDGFRYAMLGSSDADPMVGLVVLAVTNIVLYSIAFRMFAKGYRLKS